MNERIKQLSKQATTYHYGGLGTEIEVFNKEKFAELIVEDCYQKLIDMDQRVKGSHNYYKHAAIQIREHFGVEE
jgi:hypothetical protein